MELCDYLLTDLLELMNKKEVSALEVTQSALQRIARVDGRSGSLDAGELSALDRQTVHAFITVTEERALQKAQEVDASRLAGEDPGVLAGIPFTVKDIFCVEGTRTTASSRILANFTSPYSATAVERMEAAGGVMLGKVNLDEFTFGSSNESSAFQPCPRNPWNPRHVTGGSSGGSAAAVAAGEGTLSLGTDTAGSIRQPAAYCGVVGMKPTFGRVSRYGLIAFASSLDCPGPLARDVRGAARMLGVIAGVDPRDSTSVSLPAEGYWENLERGVKGLRIGLSPDYFRITYPNPDGSFSEQALPEEIRARVYAAADVLSRMGAEIIEDVPMPNTRHGIPAFFVISRVEAASNLHRFDGVNYGYRTEAVVEDLRDLYKKTRSEAFGLQPKLRVLMGMYVSGAQFAEQYYQRAQKVRSMIRADFEAVFSPMGDYRLDALLTPTTATSAFELDALYGDSVLMQYADQMTVPANHAGIPALSLPAGFDPGGLPLGIQLLGADFQEAKLLQIGRAYEIGTADEAWRGRLPEMIQAA